MDSDGPPSACETPARANGHPAPLAWLFFWWLFPIYLLRLVVIAVFFVVLLPVNIVRLYSPRRSRSAVARRVYGRTNQLSGEAPREMFVVVGKRASRGCAPTVPIGIATGRRAR